MITPRLSRDQLRGIKRMSLSELDAFLQRYYRAAFIDGLREGESEYDDSIIINAEEVEERLNDEEYERLVNGKI